MTDEISDCDAPLLTPLECALELFRYVENALNSPEEEFLELVELDFVWVALGVHPGIEVVVQPNVGVHYIVDDDAAESLGICAAGLPEAKEMVRQICAGNIHCGLPVPPRLRAYCDSFLRGLEFGERRRGPKAGKQFGLFYVATTVCEYLHHGYGISRTRADGMAPDSAADITSEAFAIRGIDCSYTRIRDFLTSRKHADNRRKTDSINQMFSENHLVALGIIRPQPRRRLWVNGAFE